MKKILIVEDDLSYMQLLQDKIKEEGYKVFSAAEGHEGLDIALKEHPDLILLDIIMPVMDGMSMLSEIRKDPYGSKVMVIILTNLEPNPEMIKKILKDQPTYYLIKSDIKRSELISLIKKLFGETKVSLSKAA